MNSKRHTGNSLPDHPHSYWLDSADSTAFSPVSEDFHTEAIIIGGGISGITTAYLLSQQGIKVTILEAGRVSGGTTGYTTAKLTAQHNLIYDKLMNNGGEEQAKLYYQANQQAVDYVRQLTEEKKIDCDFKQEDAYVYAETDEERQKLDKEAEAYQKLGINHRYETDIPLDIETKGALAMPAQAQFHPVKYLQFLVEEIIQAGGKVFENTRAVDMKTGKHPVVTTASGHQVSGDYVVVCSHYPFYDKEGFYFARMYPSRSYLLAAKTTKAYPGGMYISAGSPVKSLRSAPVNGEEHVLIGGYGHPIGHKEDTMENYEKLRQFGEQSFGIEDILYRWSSQDPSTLDNIPYIGNYAKGESNIFVATGYDKWGMSNGTLAGMLIRDLITGNENPYQQTFSPQRPDERKNAKEMIHMNKHNAKMFVKEKMQKPDKTIDDVKNDEGMAVTANGQRAGAYRDETGKVFLVDTACTHMGCEVKWNNGERSWDCPCHGSRFRYDGKVIEGPATEPLNLLDPQEE